MRKTLLILTALFALGLSASAAEPPMAAPAQLTLPNLSAPATIASPQPADFSLWLDATPQLQAGGPLASELPPATPALICPNHPPGWCCVGPPTCRCTRGSCA